MSAASCALMVFFRKPMPPLFDAMALRIVLELVPFMMLLMFCLGLDPWQEAQLPE